MKNAIGINLLSHPIRLKKWMEKKNPITNGEKKKTKRMSNVKDKN